MRHRNSRSETFAGGVASTIYEPVGSTPSPPHSLSGGMIALNHPEVRPIEREAFDSPPVFNSFQRKQYFDFPSKLRRFAAGLRNPAYQLGFLLSAG